MATKNLLRHLQSRRGLDPFHSYFHHSGAATLRLAFWDWTLRVKGCRNSQSPGIIFSSEVMLTALFGRVLRTSISIKSDTAYLQMRCAWTIWNLNILQTSLGFVVWKSCGWRHSWNLPWLPERPATVTKTLVTLAGFLRQLLRHFFFLPMVFLSESTRFNFSLGDPNQSEYWPIEYSLMCHLPGRAVGSYSPPLVSSSMLSCLGSLSLLLPGMNAVGQWVFALSIRKVGGNGKVF